MPRQRNIEEEFRAIAPPGSRGIPAAQPIAVGITGSGGADSAASMSQASQEIALLQAQFQQQANLIQQNTQALLNNTSSQGGSVASDVLGHVGGGIGGGLGLLSPVVTGLFSLFGIGSRPAPAPLPYYTAPPGVQISDTLRSAPAGGGAAQAGSGAGAGAAQVTVNVSAMDSQSFMDRSSDIASAVREAMLNLHPINDVVASL